MGDKTCKSCDNEINEIEVTLRCDQCRGRFHGGCVFSRTMSGMASIQQAVRSKWICKSCDEKRNRRPQRDDEASRRTVFFGNKKELHSVEMESKTTAMLTAIVGEMTRQNQKLQNELDDLQLRFEGHKQLARCNCLDIVGVPESGEQEDLHAVVKKMGAVLGVWITDDMIDLCHRKGPPKRTRRVIFVKFTRRTVKDAVLRGRMAKGYLTAHDLGFMESGAVYINESLTPDHRMILTTANAMKRENVFAFVWVRNGKVFVRKDENSDKTMVTSLKQLASMCNQNKRRRHAESNVAGVE